MKWKSDYLHTIVLVLFIGLCIYGQLRSNAFYPYVEEHGVWTIYEIGRVHHTSKGGKQAPMFYSYRGEKFRDGVYLGSRLNVGDRGYRYFMALMPEKPKKHIYTFDPVPDWFTLDAPPEGWPTRPTEAELREMMVRDSLKPNPATASPDAPEAVPR